jgi:hypothetical protein
MISENYTEKDFMEAAVAQFQVLIQELPGGTEETTKNFRKDSHLGVEI